MIRLLYRAAWALATPVSALLPAGSKTGRALVGRRRAADTLAAWAGAHRTTAPLVWFHAASVGEGRQAEAVLRDVRQRQPGWQIVYTFSSPSAERLAGSLPVDAAGYLPRDTPGDVGRALDAVRPDALVFAATDLWPVLVEQATRRGVCVALVSAALSPVSGRARGPAARLLRPAYRSLDAVGAVDPADAHRLESIGVRPEVVTVTGDTRHDSAAARVRGPAPDLPALRLMREPGAPVLLAGSTWEPDERLLVETLAAWPAERRPRLVVAPHEPSDDHVARLTALLERLPGTTIRRLSAPDRPSAPWTVLVVDQVGQLADLYRAADVAWVGGGLHAAGLHSVIEPAACAVPVLFGPRWQNSRDAGLLLEAGAARAIGDAGALSAALEQWTADDAARRGAGAAARAVAERGLGAAERSADLVIRLVESRPRA